MAKKPRFDLLRLDPDFSDPETLLSRVQERQIRAAYSSLRTTLKKRLERLSKSEFADSAMTVEQMNRLFPPLAKNMSARNVAYQTISLLNRLESRTTSVTGMREKQKDTVKTLQQQGINVTEDNLKYYGQFMDYARSVALATGKYDPEIPRSISDYINEKLERGEEPYPVEWEARYRAFQKAQEENEEVSRQAEKEARKQAKRVRKRQSPADRGSRGSRGK